MILLSETSVLLRNIYLFRNFCFSMKLSSFQKLLSFRRNFFLFGETFIFSSAVPPSPRPTMPPSVLNASLGEHSFLSQHVLIAFQCLIHVSLIMFPTHKLAASANHKRPSDCRELTKKLMSDILTFEYI